MFGLGPTELVVIFVLALLVLGPDKIPTAAAQLGKAIRHMRKMGQDVRTQVDEQGQLGQSLQDLHAAIRGDLSHISADDTKKTRASAVPADLIEVPRTVSTTDEIEPPLKQGASQPEDSHVSG